MLPTKKTHVSFSEISTWLNCSWQHKLVHVEKKEEYDGNVYADFGKVLHDTLENYLKTKILEKDQAYKKITDFWLEKGYPGDNWPTYKHAVPDLDYWIKSIDAMLDSAVDILNEEFPSSEWELHEAEESLYVPIDGTPYFFKAYIDAVLKKVDKKGKTTYFIIDWKNCAHTGWHPSKMKDNKVHLQLMLYKLFWSKKHNVPLKDIKCGFILLKRQDPDPKKRKKIKATLLPVSLGPKTTERALKTIRNMITSLNKSVFIKNKENCVFCVFKSTEHCKINL